MSDLNVLVRTGNGRIIVPVEKFGYKEWALPTEPSAVAIPEVGEVWVEAEDFLPFIEAYADMRNLNLVYDADGAVFGLFNERHNSFRRITYVHGSVNLFEFIEPEFVII